MRTRTRAVTPAPASKLAAAVPSDLPDLDTFEFNGTTSDIALQLYRRYVAGDEVAQLELLDVPDRVVARLTDAGVASFDDLPGLVQRAVLWDTGFVISPDNAPKQIWTLDDRGMADIAVPIDDFSAVKCTTLNCSQPDGSMALNSLKCNETQILSVARCVAEGYDGKDADRAFWATGGNATIIPELRLVEHSWTDADGSNLVYAVHTAAADAEAESGACSTNNYGSLVVPCYPFRGFSGSKSEPPLSSWVTEWLSDFRKASPTKTPSTPHDTSGSLLVDGANFAFDGTNSDIAKQLYLRSLDDGSAPNITLDVVPQLVIDRLKALDLEFSDLPGIAQRALLWDTGFALTPNGLAKQIWLLGEDVTMADLAVSKEEFLDVGCTPLNCTQPDGSPSYANEFCNGKQMLRAAKCVIEEHAMEGTTHLAMWSTGGDPTMVPEIRLIQHSWYDSGSSYLVYAVHTQNQLDEPSYSDCPKEYGSLVVPCYPSNNTELASQPMTVPKQSDWVNDWMKQIKASIKTDSGSNKVGGLSPGVWAAIGGGVVLLIIFIAIAVCLIRRWKRSDKLDDHHHGIYSEYTASQDMPECGGRSMTQSIRDNSEDTERRTASTAGGTSRRMPTEASMRGSHFSNSFEANGILKTLHDDPNLASKVLAYDALHFTRELSKGAFGEVWLCEYGDRQVAVKRLLQNRQQKFDDLQTFAAEIQVSASLNHPNIVEVVGVAWNSLMNLVLVLEYIPMGDMQEYLRKQGDLMSWARDKIHLAIGIARALEYLHTRDPPLIHRDLKSKNVLLTRDLNPKIIDFGVTRHRVDSSMTAGVGTPYWTAPELLNGHHYTEQTDVYSFGVLLTEIDTGRLPYHDAITQDGTKLRPIQILNNVASGTLRPSFSADCPPRVRRIGVACLQHDPARRPTAKSLVEILGG